MTNKEIINRLIDIGRDAALAVGMIYDESTPGDVISENAVAKIDQIAESIAAIKNDLEVKA